MTMSDGELKILHQKLETTQHYLEFGSGDSTVHASGYKNILRIDSVESSHQYIDENLIPQTVVNQAIKDERLHFHIVDLGKTKSWGYPVDDSKKHLWPNYSLCPFISPSKHDLVLIDGRFRVACALSCLLNTPDNCTIMIHDFWNRPKLYFLLRYFEVQHQVDKLGVFTKKPNLDNQKIARQLRRYQYIVNDHPIEERIKRAFIKKRYKKPKSEAL